jgi:general L-amino acid transport system permease protein
MSANLSTHRPAPCTGPHRRSGGLDTHQPVWRLGTSLMHVPSSRGCLLWYFHPFCNGPGRAVWVPNYDACRADGCGACWGVIAEKYRLIIFGRYPFEEQWRPLVCHPAAAGSAGRQLHRAFWKPWLAACCGWLCLPLFFTLMYGNTMG